MEATTETPPEIIEVLRSAEIKLVVADGSVLKLFAVSSNNALANMETQEGSSIPEENSLVIGSAEANMMREENLIQNPGDELEDLFGIDTTVGGILKETGTIIDDMHFVSAQQYRQIDGQEGRVFVAFTAEGSPKTFYLRGEGEEMPIPLVFAEGVDTGYVAHDIAGTTYYPVIIGAAEAQMMREEKLFEKPGDLVRGFFGKDIVIVGVLAPTNTALDMMHITPLREDELT